MVLCKSVLSFVGDIRELGDPGFLNYYHLAWMRSSGHNESIQNLLFTYSKNTPPNFRCRMSKLNLLGEVFL